MERFRNQTTLTAASHATSAAAIVVQQVLLARCLPPQAFGELAALQALVFVVDSLLVTRAGEVALFWVARNWSANRATAIGYSLFLRRRELSWSVSIYLLIVASGFAATFAYDFDLLLFALLGLSIPAQSGYGVDKSLLTAAAKLRDQSILEITTSICALTLSGGLLLLSGAYGFALGVSLTAAIKTLITKAKTAALREEQSGTQAIPVPNATSTLYSLVRNTAYAIGANADVFLLSLASSTEGVAFYKVARSMANLPSKMAAPLWSVLRPSILRSLDETGGASVLQLIKKPSTTFALAGLIAAPVVYLASGYIFEVVYGDSYRASRVPFLILLPAMWAYSAVTGWFGFLSAISSRKAVPMLVFLGLSLSILTGGLILGDSPLRMAVVVAASYILATCAAWCLLARKPDLIAR